MNAPSLSAPEKISLSSPGEIALAAQAACLLEVSAPKPGNVNRSNDFSDTVMEDFLLSSLAIGRAMAQAGRCPVGATILKAGRATRRVVPCNTNLGTILLFAPLARASLTGRTVVPENAGGEERQERVRPQPLGEASFGLRERVRWVLAGLGVRDARMAYRAIRLVRPGGLGQAGEADVMDEPQVTLLEAMTMAGERDSIAREYATGYQITFEVTKPALEEGLKGLRFPDAVAHAFLATLAAIPDTLIARKKGPDATRTVSLEAAGVLRAGGLLSPSGRRALEEFDRWLRRTGDNSLNPGATADLTAAAIFAFLIENGLGVWRKHR